MRMSTENLQYSICFWGVNSYFKTDAMGGRQSVLHVWGPFSCLHQKNKKNIQQNLQYTQNGMKPRYSTVSWVLGRWNFRVGSTILRTAKRQEVQVVAPLFPCQAVHPIQWKAFFLSWDQKFQGLTLRTWQPWCTSHGFGSIFLSTQQK